jgi:hypothetical protein
VELYRMFFVGSMQFAAAKPIWKAWAPLKVKFFMWLAVRSNIWEKIQLRSEGMDSCIPVGTFYFEL